MTRTCMLNVYCLPVCVELLVERIGSWVERRLSTPGYESCGAVLKPRPWAGFFHSILLQFTQLYK